MKLTQLEYFCVAARYHNITKAAKELFVTQPSISNAIRALEEEFGVNPHVLLNTSQITTLLNMVKTEQVGTFLYRSIVDAHPEIIGIPVMPSIEQRIGVIWKKGKYQNTTTEKVIKYIENF